MSARTAALLLISAVVGLVALFVLGLPAHAAPTPSPTPTKSEDPCGLVYGPAHQECEEQTGGGGSGGGGSTPSLGDPTSTLDPLSSLADGIAKTAAWVVDQLSNAVATTTEVDFTNSQFLKTYSLVFAASAFLVVLLWLWAVIKRAIRGVPLTTALGEAVGLLWVTVLASAFTPLILYTIVAAVDGLTQALAGEGSTKFFSAFAEALRSDDTAQDGGPFARICLSLVSIIAAGVVWLELVVRAALLYVGAVLGLVVYSGIVDRKLWERVRKWAGIMVALILVEPIIVIVLRLASAMSEGGKPADSTAAIISGLAIIVIAIMASALLFRFVPGMGDEIVAARRDTYDPASRQAAAVVTRPVTGITAGINTHASRDVSARPSTPAQSSSVAHAQGGIATHSTRPSSSGGSPPAPTQNGQGNP